MHQPLDRVRLLHLDDHRHSDDHQDHQRQDHLFRHLRNRHRQDGAHQSRRQLDDLREVRQSLRQLDDLREVHLDVDHQDEGHQDVGHQHPDHLVEVDVELLGRYLRDDHLQVQMDCCLVEVRVVQIRMGCYQDEVRPDAVLELALDQLQAWGLQV